METKEKSNEIKYLQSLFLLRVLYSKLLEILDVFCGKGGLVLVKNDQLNYFYVIIKKSIKDILGDDYFKDLAKESPELFESLIGDVEDADIEWEFESKNAYNFLAKIENLFILSGANSFELSKPIKDKLEETNNAIKQHKEICNQTWGRVKDNIGKIKNELDFGNNTPPKEQSEKQSSYFSEGKSILTIGTKEVKIKKFSDQYNFLKIVFKSEDLKREWFFSEVIDQYDLAEAAPIPDKKFYNAAYQIDLKIMRETGIKDFFLTRTAQSFQINPEYLS
jgi:hypothetical protein